MAYDTAQPPALTSQKVGSNNGAFWIYDSADVAADIDTDGYITNGRFLGLQVGDFVFHVDSTGVTVAGIHIVTARNADGSVNLSDTTALTVTDTD